MAFVQVPKDLSTVKSKVALNLTKRQLICFGTAAAIGVPTYIFTRGAIGNSMAAFLMIGLMLPLFFIAMYEKDGQPAEVILRNYIRVRFFYSGIRPYKTENLYEIIEKEENFIDSENKTTNAAGKTSDRRKKSSKEK
jgi:hypothetical protein